MLRAESITELPVLGRFLVNDPSQSTGHGRATRRARGRTAHRRKRVSDRVYRRATMARASRAVAPSSKLRYSHGSTSSSSINCQPSDVATRSTRP